MSECIFCRIASGAIPSQKVAETDRLLAFRDISPQAPTHILLIPKQHVVDSAAELSSAHADLLGELFEMAARLASSERLSGGWRLLTNVGSDGGQSVSHLHFHLLGGRRMQWPPG